MGITDSGHLSYHMPISLVNQPAQEPKLRFVLVKTGDKKCIFVRTDLTLDPVTIIELYSWREKIEACSEH